MKRPRCPGYARHWYTADVYVPAPVCARCGAPRPGGLKTEEWAEFAAYVEGRYTPEGTRAYWHKRIREAGLWPIYRLVLEAREMTRRAT